MQYWTIEEKSIGTCLTLLPGWDLDVDNQFLQYMENHFDPSTTKRLTIDLSKMNHLNSMTIGILVNISKRVKQQGGKVALYSPSKTVQDLFADIGLLSHFLIFYTIRDLENFFGTIPKQPHA
jgi:anti-anti-sigma factor